MMIPLASTECYYCGGPTEPWVSEIIFCLVHRCARIQCFESEVYSSIRFMHREGWYEAPEKGFAYFGDALLPAIENLERRGMIEKVDGIWLATDRAQERCPFYLIGMFMGCGPPRAAPTCYCDRPVGHPGKHTSGSGWHVPTRFERVKSIPLSNKVELKQ